MTGSGDADQIVPFFPFDISRPLIDMYLVLAVVMLVPLVKGFGIQTHQFNVGNSTIVDIR